MYKSDFEAPLYQLLSIFCKERAKEKITMNKCSIDIKIENYMPERIMKSLFHKLSMM